MPLESLLELVETLRARIDEHGAALRQSEALTRATLIDPLLRELGWDTEDPALVIPEYRSAAGSADYALIGIRSQPPALIIEAKKLGEPLDDKVALQSLNYCNLIGTPHFALTDGKSWKIYATFEQAPLADRVIATFSIGDMAAAEVCLKALALWRPSVIESKVSTGQIPIVGLEDVQQRTVAKPVEEEVVEAPAQVVSDPSQPEAVTQVKSPTSEPSEQASQINEIEVADWIPLPELDSPTDTTPAEIMFPDRSKEGTESWAQLIEDVTRWLYDNRHLSSKDMPMQLPRATKRFIINDSPFHIEGGAFSKQSRHVGPFYIETNVNAEQIVRNTRFIIERIGQDPAQFKVRLSS